MPFEQKALSLGINFVLMMVFLIIVFFRERRDFKVAF
jgi:hypothetical protein